MSKKRKYKLVIDDQKPSCSNYKPSTNKPKRNIRQLVEEGESENDQIHTKARKLESKKPSDHASEMDTAKVTKSEDNPHTNEKENQIKIFLDVNKPLTALRSMLQIVFRRDLKEYTFYLSDSKKLDDNKTLVEHCVSDQREGSVILTCELKVSKANGKTINIIDVCKRFKKVTYEMDTDKVMESNKSKDIEMDIDKVTETNKSKDTPVTDLKGNEIEIIMDIKQPLKTLRALLEKELDQKLGDYTFMLKDFKLDDQKNLIAHGVDGEGLVLIKCELKDSLPYGKTVNIIDVLMSDEVIMDETGTANVTESKASEDIPHTNKQENEIKIIMDINKPLTALRSMLQSVLHQDLRDYTFYLRDSKKEEVKEMALENYAEIVIPLRQLDDKNTLAEHCFLKKGSVIIHCELKFSKANEKTINIINVTKRDKETMDAAERDHKGSSKDQKVSCNADPSFKKDQVKLGIPEAAKIDHNGSSKDQKVSCNVDPSFKKDQVKLGIPEAAERDHKGSSKDQKVSCNVDHSFKKDQVKLGIPEAAERDHKGSLKDQKVSCNVEPSIKKDQVKLGIPEEMNMDKTTESIKPKDTPDTELEGKKIMIIMDIKEPLTTLRSLLEEELSRNLGDYTFTLQKTEKLDDIKNLVNQCVHAEGLVQIKCELENTLRYGKTINITDVIMNTQEYIEILSNAENNNEGFSENRKVRWVVDPYFKINRIKRGIPEDPCKWTNDHVRYWIIWAVRQFGLSGIKLSDWNITGLELSKMTHEGFNARVPEYCSNSFWTHFKLLQGGKIVAVIKSELTKVDVKGNKRDVKIESRTSGPPQGLPKTNESGKILGGASSNDLEDKKSITIKSNLKWNCSNMNVPSQQFAVTKLDSTREHGEDTKPFDNIEDKVCKPPQESPEANESAEILEEVSKDNGPLKSNRGLNRIGRNVLSRPLLSPSGEPVQLWVYLLDLLTDWRHRKNIQWVGDGSRGEFRLSNPEYVAYLWGLKKNNHNMNYGKMSRTLRNYYNRELLSKVPGKKHVYRFDIDLKALCGFSPAELQAEVIQAEIRNQNQL